MKENKLETISNLFEGNEIRSVWDSKKKEYYFSVVDVIAASNINVLSYQYIDEKLIEDNKKNRS